MKTELSDNDRQRIEQEARNNYSKNTDYPMEQAAFKIGAEYATLFERQQCDKIIERATADGMDTIVMLDQKVKQLEAKRSELRTIEDVVKAFEAGKLAGQSELRNKVIELQRYHQTLIARYYNETMTAGEHEVLNTIIDEIDKMLIKWNSPKEV